jgi:hypothetical protein
MKVDDSVWQDRTILSGATSCRQHRNSVFQTEPPSTAPPCLRTSSATFEAFIKGPAVERRHGEAGVGARIAYL